MKTGILLINLGTPNSPSVKDVRIYLREFLMDKYVIDLPFLQRWFLVNLIIATFRAPKSAEAYQQLWTKKGSPLLFNSQELADNLQQEIGDKFVVELGMRYGNPSIKRALNGLINQKMDSLVVIPLYPQYASSSTLSSIEKTKEIIKKSNFKGEVKFIENFFESKEFIASLAKNGKKYLDKETYDHVLFSYHSIPERHVLQDDKNDCCKLNDTCCASYSEKNRLCYRAQCLKTTDLLVAELGLPNNYSTSFQSRLITRKKEFWLQPYTDEVIIDLAKQGKKKVLVFSPAFVADCLETTVEIAMEYHELFIEHGGEKIQLVDSVNSNAEWLLPLIKV